MYKRAEQVGILAAQTPLREVLIITVAIGVNAVSGLFAFVKSIIEERDTDQRRAWDLFWLSMVGPTIVSALLCLISVLSELAYSYSRTPGFYKAGFFLLTIGILSLFISGCTYWIGLKVYFYQMQRRGFDLVPHHRRELRGISEAILNHSSTQLRQGINGRIIDASRGGLCCAVEEYVITNIVVDLRIDLPGGSLPVTNLKVLRSAEAVPPVDSKHYIVVFQFSGVIIPELLNAIERQPTILRKGSEEEKRMYPRHVVDWPIRIGVMRIVPSMG